MLLTLPETYLDLQFLQNVLLGGGLLLWLVLETLFPALGFADGRGRLTHLSINVALWLIAAVLVSLTLGGWLLYAQFWLEYNAIGLLRLAPLPVWLMVPLGVLLLDFGDYAFHRLSHQTRWLWLLHAVHHSDGHLDVSTSLRAHPLHVFASFTWKLLLVAALGIPVWVAMLRDALAIPVNQFHHSNLRLPAWLERALRWLIITPPVHRLHHSPERPCTDANFGGLFPFWDRLLGTYREPVSALPPAYGLDRLRGPHWQGLRGTLMTPWWTRRMENL